MASFMLPNGFILVNERIELLPSGKAGVYARLAIAFGTSSPLTYQKIDEAFS